ncbi:hypothetical protein ACQEVF_10025 [Nonomuraea polychroma]|jgi:hypothetical protein|uniref:Uncharacterized protein n=1 Tax=Nonomuraea polychroma TaxID=46176 RepID=A0A438MP68_9ACTN|nr:hypothetical protein [Nonomuraea polychroma]RVX47618.1 hypothetical protein EDD27_10557 [Nonomuraea polychroma]
MSDQHIDPAGNTQAFRAFAQAREQEASAKPKKSPLLPIIAVVAAIVIVGVAAFLLLQ